MNDEEIVEKIKKKYYRELVLPIDKFALEEAIRLAREDEQGKRKVIELAKKSDFEDYCNTIKRCKQKARADLVAKIEKLLGIDQYDKHYIGDYYALTVEIREWEKLKKEAGE